MASSGIVQSVSGIVKAIAVDGTERVLQVGDRVLPNEQIVTGNTGVISIEFADGTTLDLGRNSVTILDDETINYEANLAPSAPTSEQAQLAEVEAMQKAIAEGEEFDPSKLEATAAGAPGAGGPGEDDGHTFVNVDYLQPTATPESGFETTGISTAFPETQEPLILNPEQQPIPVAEVEPPAEPPIEPPVDTVPTAGTTTVLLDEDDLIADEVLPAIFDALRVEFESSTGYVAVNPFAVGANDQADGDDLPPNSPTVLTGFLTADYGDNGPGSIVFNPASAQPAGMTSGGENIQYWISNDGHSLIGFIVNNQSGPTGGTLVRGVDTQVPTYAQIIFTAEITDATTMAFRTALYGPVDHLDVTTEDNLLFNLSFTVSDIDGDSAQGILLLNLDDDSPIVTINEFGVASLNVVEASGIDSAQSAVISLATDIQPGADGLGSSSTSYALALAGTADSGLVTTDGNHPITLVVSPDGQIVTGQYQDNGPQTAFTVSLVGNQVSLVSNVALEHANAPQNTEDDTLDLNGLINVVATVAVTDGDNDQVIAQDNTTTGLNLSFNDTDPTVNITTAATVDALAVTEASLQTGQDSATITAPVFTASAVDGYSSSTSYALALAGTADSGLVTTDGNHPITLVVSPDGQTVTGQYQDNGPQTAFTVSLVGNQVSLVSNVALEHANAPQNTEDDTLDLNGLINVVATVAVTDGDNDQVIAQDNTTTGLSLTFNDTDPTVNITTAATVDALAVTEASLQPGQDSATITAPVFTASAVDGYSSSTSYALALAGTADSGLVTTDGNHPITLVVSPDGQTVTGQYQDNGTQTAFTVSLVGNQVSLVSNVALEHANAPQNTEDDTLDLNGLIDVVTTVAVTDGDNDQVIAQHNTTTGLELTFNDTDPVSLTPTALHIIDLATANGTTENLHFLTGADGVQTVRFNFSDGDAARDVDGNRLSFNGEFLYLHYADNGTDFTRMEATTSPTLGSGEVGFWIDIDPDANTYTMHSNGVISNGTAITSAEIAEIGGGNSEWLAFIDLSKSTEDAFMTTKSGDSVNTNNAEIGISAGNSFTPTEGYRIDFVNGLTTDKVQGVETYNISGAHNLTNSFRQVLSTVNPGNNDNGGVDGRADITLAAIIANDVDNIFYGDADDVLISLNPSNVNVYDSNGNIVPDGQQGLSYIDNGDTITLLGLQEDWTFEIETDVKFNAVQVDAYDTTAEFKLGLFSYGEDYFGDPVDLSYQITGIDGDGDMVDGQINAVLYPADATFDGSDLDDTYQGSDTVDYLLGNEGDDNLSGLDGDDVLVGGEGTDTLTGGGGSDRFVMTNGDVPDVIKDFTVGNLNSENGAIDPNADILDVTDVLAGAEITSSDFSANPANYLHLDTTTQPGSTIVSLDLDGSGAGLSLMTVVTLEGTETDLDTLLDNGQIDYS